MEATAAMAAGGSEAPLLSHGHASQAESAALAEQLLQSVRAAMSTGGRLEPRLRVAIGRQHDWLETAGVPLDHRLLALELTLMALALPDHEAVDGLEEGVEGKLRSLLLRLAQGDNEDGQVVGWTGLAMLPPHHAADHTIKPPMEPSMEHAADHTINDPVNHPMDHPTDTSLSSDDGIQWEAAFACRRPRVVLLAWCSLCSACVNQLLPDTTAQPLVKTVGAPGPCMEAPHSQDGPGPPPPSRIPPSFRLRQGFLAVDRALQTLAHNELAAAEGTLSIVERACQALADVAVALPSAVDLIAVQAVTMLCGMALQSQVWSPVVRMWALVALDQLVLSQDEAVLAQAACSGPILALVTTMLLEAPAPLESSQLRSAEATAALPANTWEALGEPWLDQAMEAAPGAPVGYAVLVFRHLAQACGERVAELAWPTVEASLACEMWEKQRAGLFLLSTLIEAQAPPPPLHNDAVQARLVDMLSASIAPVRGEARQRC
jgi:hypothetical protein